MDLKDRYQVVTTSGPWVLAAPRNPAITVLRLAGATGIAAAQRYHA